MARANTKIGDVFSVKLDNGTKRYMQYIITDRTQLNSDVVQAFKTTYPAEAEPELSTIVSDAVDFYAHCVTQMGIKMGLWEKAGNVSDIGSTDHILFRDTNDSGRKLGEEPVKVSERWYVWHINDEHFTRVGKLTVEYQQAELGIVVNPFDIIKRMQTGHYDFVYPGY